MNTIKTSEQQLEKVGKIVPSSKLKYTWVFSIEGDNYTVNLYHSKLTGKFEVRVNGKRYMVERGKTAEQFKYIARLTNHEVKILKPSGAETFHLFIDRKDFTSIHSPETTETVDSLNTLKTKTENDDSLRNGQYHRMTYQHPNINLIKDATQGKPRQMSVDHKAIANQKIGLRHPKTTDYGDINYGAFANNKKVEGTLNGLQFSGTETSDIFFNDGVNMLDVQQDCDSNFIKKVNTLDSK